MIKQISIFALAALMLAGCNNATYVQRESPANIYKDYKGEERAAVLGVGEPLSKRQMQANATMSLKGSLPLDEVMNKMARTFNVAIRWGNGVRDDVRANVLVSDLTFNEVRGYIEDAYDVQLVREGERRILVLPAADAKRVEAFSPGINVSLSQAVRGLAQQCDMNLVITENKDKLANTKVTTSLHDVTCDDAFRALLNPQGLSLQNYGDYYTIGGLPMRQWTVNLYEPVRTETQNVSYEAETDSGDTGGSNMVGSSASVGTTVDRDLWAELTGDLQDLLNNSCSTGSSTTAGASTGGGSDILSPPGTDLSAATTDTNTGAATSSSGSEGSNCGYVRINKSVGLVQMQAPQSVLDTADEIITHTADVASRRLLVEARVLAVTRTRGFDQDGALKAGGRSLNGVQTATFNDVSSVVGNINNELRSLASNTTGGAFSFGGGDLDAVVRLVESYGTTYQLMRPTIEVMDRQRSVLIDGTNRKYFIIETTQQTNADGTPGDETTEVEERTQFVGLQFSVSAQVGDEGEPHTVALQIPMTEVVDTVVIPDGNNSEVPIVSTRLIDQKVRLRDGEIKAVGGLTRTLAVDTESGLPLVRGVPAFGKLFNEENISYEEVEFVVLLQVKRLY